VDCARSRLGQRGRKEDDEKEYPLSPTRKPILSTHAVSRTSPGGGLQWRGLLALAIGLLGLGVVVLGVAALAQGAGRPSPSFLPQVHLWFLALELAGGIFLIMAVLTLIGGGQAGSVPDEAALQALEEQLAAQPHLILTLSPEGRALSAYGTVPEGISLDALFDVGLVQAAAKADQSALLAAIEAATRDGKGRAGFCPRHAAQAYAVVDLRHLADGRLSAILRDASLEHSNEVRLETARIEADDMNAGKSRFLANMSHELRTPLNAIMGFSDIMRTQMFGPLTGKYAEYVGLIHESGRHLLDLINDVLDMSKIQAQRYELTLEIFDIREPVSAALRLLRVQADEAGVKLRGSLPTGLIEANADRRALKQIVINLVSNAIKFTPAGGQITVNLQAYGDILDLSVIDNGIGISAEDVSRLGRPFEQVGDTTRNIGGTGLGLSLVRAFAELHGGEMIIESRLGEGTTVTVRLPVLDVAPISLPDPEEADEARANVVAFPGGRPTQSL
jgi:cell cycle sensor histidine kinase DivJ